MRLPSRSIYLGLGCKYFNIQAVISQWKNIKISFEELLSSCMQIYRQLSHQFLQTSGLGRELFRKITLVLHSNKFVSHQKQLLFHHFCCNISEVWQKILCNTSSEIVWKHIPTIIDWKRKSAGNMFQSATSVKWQSPSVKTMHHFTSLPPPSYCPINLLLYTVFLSKPPVC